MKYFLKLLLGATVLTILIRTIDSKNVLANFLSIPLSIVAYSSSIFMLSWFVAAYKWNMLLPISRYKEILSLSYVGQFYSWIIPGQIAGDFIKGFRLGKGRHDAELLAMSVLIDKLTGLIGLLCVAAIGLILSDSQLPSGVGHSIGFLTILLLTGLWSVSLPLVYRGIVARVTKIGEGWPRCKPLSSRILLAIEGWRYFTRRPGRLAAAILLGAGIQCTGVANTMLLASAMGINVSLLDWCWVVGLVAVAVLLPVSIGGIGVREGAFAGALLLLGIPIEKSVALSLACFAVTLLGVLVGGILELAHFSRGPQI